MKTRTSPKLTRAQIERNKEEFNSIPESEKVPVTEEEFDSVWLKS